MSRFVRIGLLLVFAGVARAVAEDARAEAPLPFRGELGGEVKIAALAEAGLTWRASLTVEGVWLAARAEGVELDVLATPVSGALDAWRWQVRRGDIDLGVWWPQLRGLAGEAAAGWSASGRLTLAGEGAWSAANGPTGEVSVKLREGWARSDALELEVSVVELDATTTDLVAGSLTAGQTLRVGKAVKAGAEVSDIAVDFGFTAARVLEVSRVEAGFLGGRVKLRPFRLARGDFKVAAAADVEGVQLAEVAKLMPWAVEEAAGRLRGRIELDWDVQRGLRVRDGGLDIVRVDGAEFRLAPAPGMLTGDMPPKFGFFPQSWRLFRGLGFTNPAYAPLREIELGREGLRIETLRVSFWPDGVGVGRTAAMHVVGKPTGGKLVEEVVIDLNFHGPWTDFLSFGLNQEANYQFRIQ
jgi:hypothetical protein